VAARGSKLTRLPLALRVSSAAVLNARVCSSRSSEPISAKSDVAARGVKLTRLPWCCVSSAAALNAFPQRVTL
jgi:hypothetical protein